MGLNGGAGIPIITATATGNPLSFATDMVRPLKSLVIALSSVGGQTGVNVTHTSENLLVVDGGYPGKILAVGGTLDNNSAFWTSKYFSISPGDYVITSEVYEDIVLGLYTDEDYRTMRRTYITEQQFPYHFTVQDPYRYCRMSVYKYKTAEHPGGVLAKSVNVLPVTFTDPIHAGTLTLNEDGSADLDADGNSYHLSNIGVITTFEGTNAIWTDTNGTNTATYLKHQS